MRVESSRAWTTRQIFFRQNVQNVISALQHARRTSRAEYRNAARVISRWDDRFDFYGISRAPKGIDGPYCGETPLDNREMPTADDARAVDGGEVITMGKEPVINSDTTLSERFIWFDPALFFAGETLFSRTVFRVESPARHE